ncbi:MAG: hypothetical protein LBI03_00725 [Clostridiales bacterium]|jgi:hypothetical protein|nr:hypothetical protein [Clostridiales bacterium]
MDRARVLVDFNELNSPMPISKTDCVIDSDGNSIVLVEGMDIHLYEHDYDEFNRQDNLIADGIVVCNPDEHQAAKWCCQINTLGVRHESDEADFHLPELSADEKRNITYKKLDRWISLIGSKPNVIVQGAMKTYMKILRRIDNGEL